LIRGRNIDGVTSMRFLKFTVTTFFCLLAINYSSATESSAVPLSLSNQTLQQKIDITVFSQSIGANEKTATDLFTYFKTDAERKILTNTLKKLFFEIKKQTTRPYSSEIPEGLTGEDLNTKRSRVLSDIYIKLFPYFIFCKETSQTSPNLHKNLLDTDKDTPLETSLYLMGISKIFNDSLQKIDQKYTEIETQFDEGERQFLKALYVENRSEDPDLLKTLDDCFKILFPSGDFPNISYNPNFSTYIGDYQRPQTLERTKNLIFCKDFLGIDIISTVDYLDSFVSRYLIETDLITIISPLIHVKRNLDHHQEILRSEPSDDQLEEPVKYWKTLLFQHKRKLEMLFKEKLMSVYLCIPKVQGLKNYCDPNFKMFKKGELSNIDLSYLQGIKTIFQKILSQSMSIMQDMEEIQTVEDVIRIKIETHEHFAKNITSIKNDQKHLFDITFKNALWQKKTFEPFCTLPFQPVSEKDFESSQNWRNLLNYAKSENINIKSVFTFIGSPKQREQLKYYLIKWMGHFSTCELYLKEAREITATIEIYPFLNQNDPDYYKRLLQRQIEDTVKGKRAQLVTQFMREGLSDIYITLPFFLYVDGKIQEILSQNPQHPIKKKTYLNELKQIIEKLNFHAESIQRETEHYLSQDVIDDSLQKTETVILLAEQKLFDNLLE
jgi:hypothetical protein